MAQGDLKTFDYYPFNAGKGTYNNVTDTFKYAFVTNAYSTVSKATVEPDLSSFTEVGAGGNALPGNAWTIAAGVTKLDFTDISLTKQASSPTTAKTLLIINSTAGNDCYHAIQLGVLDGDTIDLVNNDLTVTFSANGTVNITVTA